MKRIAFLLSLAVLTAFASFAVTRWLQAEEPTDTMSWLRTEFQLSPEQVARIQKLQTAYEPICADHCARIAAARGMLEKMTPKDSRYADAQRQWFLLRQQCGEATRKHLESIADIMAPEQGKRYLALIEPKISSNQHSGPFGLR